MKNTTAIFIFILLIILQFTSRFARAQPEQAETFDTFTFYLENDYVAGTDQGYTGGLQMTWSTPFILITTLIRIMIPSLDH